METKALKKQLGAAIAMVLVAAIALGAATFAWFVNNNAVTATGVNVSTSSAVPNLYITSTGQTTDTMSTKDNNNPDKLLPVSTSDGINFYDTKHWRGATQGGTRAFADEYKVATGTKGNNVYADYTFTLGVINGSMDVYFDSGAATTLAANSNMGTAGRFAIRFGDTGEWKLFKVPGNATRNGYYTDSAAEGQTLDKNYAVVFDSEQNKLVAKEFTYATIAGYGGTIDSQTGKATANDKAQPLTTINSGQTVKVTVRVWYEGCDKDCVSENALNGIGEAISGNLGFVGVQPEPTSGTGA